MVEPLPELISGASEPLVFLKLPPEWIFALGRDVAGNNQNSSRAAYTRPANEPLPPLKFTKARSVLDKRTQAIILPCLFTENRGDVWIHNLEKTMETDRCRAEPTIIAAIYNLNFDLTRIRDLTIFLSADRMHTIYLIK